MIYGIIINQYTIQWKMIQLKHETLRSQILVVLIL